MVYDFTAEEALGNRLTRSCIDHIHERFITTLCTSNILKEKVVDNYFVANTGEYIGTQSEKNLDTKFYKNNRKVYTLVGKVTWHLLELEDVPDKLYEGIMKVFNNIHPEATEKSTIKIRKENKYG